jgi:hypothetical protein
MRTRSQLLAGSLFLAGGLLLIGLALPACSQPLALPATNTPAAQTTAAVQSTTAVQPTAAAQATTAAGGDGGTTGGETTGVEAALVTYSDAKQGFAIGHPGTWTQDQSVTNGTKFVGGDNSLTLEIVTPAKGTSAMAYAQSDVAAVAAAFPGFKQLGLAPSAEVQDAIILGFEATGTSTVTGKTFTAHDERYYMPLADGRIAILTVAGPANGYDSQGIRDIALTFKVTK